MTYPISVFIIAKNEEDRIVAALESVVGWVDEVLVIDSGSSDNTVSVAEGLGAQVIFHEWKGYGPQKVFGESQCRHQWILNIDADEAVSEELKKEIQAFFDAYGAPPLRAYHVPIKIVSRFAKKPGVLAPSNDPIRFYHKAYAGFKNSTVHDSVVLYNKEERAGKLHGIMLHRCFRSYTHAVEKINFYSSMQAEHMLAKGRKPNAIRIMIEPLAAFLKAYTLRRYCLLGVDGLLESVIYAFARTLRLAKARELWKETEVVGRY
jgi:glycosyltransferase involved in cell wall biosynthesis